MGVTGMEVWLDRGAREGQPGGWWRAGETVTGAVAVSADASLHVRRLRLQLLGEARNYWVNKVRLQHPLTL